LHVDEVIFGIEGRSDNEIHIPNDPAEQSIIYSAALGRQVRLKLRIDLDGDDVILAGNELVGNIEGKRGIGAGMDARLRSVYIDRCNGAHRFEQKQKAKSAVRRGRRIMFTVP